MHNLDPVKLRSKHLNAINTLAAETHRPVEEVDKIYTDIFESLNANSRVKDYLVVLTCKKVREELR